MAEEEQEKKKPGIVRRILKWIGLGLLSILLILGLIFQAPWKVITLLFIILLACIALPRPYRKWFWLSVGVVIIILIIWVFLPDETEGWRPYTFDEELAALEAKRAIPDSENAAVIYNQLLENYDSNTFEPDFLDPNLEYLTRSKPWSSGDYPELAQWVKQHESTIAKLIEVSKMEKCRFPISCDIFRMDESMDRLAPMRRWAFLLSRVANNDLGEDRIDQGLEKQIAVLQMAKHLYQQPILVDLLVGMAIEALALRQLNRFVITCEVTEEHLSIIEETLEEIKHDWTSDLPKILEGEKLLAKNMLCSMAYEINPKGKTRLSRDPTAAMRAGFPEELPPLAYWQRKLAKAGTVLGWFGMPSTPQKAGKIIDAGYEGLYAMADPNFDWRKEPKERKLSIISTKFNYTYLIERLAGMLEKPYYKIHDLYIRVAADKRGSWLIIALRRYKNRHGRWPEGLDDVKDLVPAEVFVDPINNDCFVYKLTEGNFTLYSKGKNNIDEGGEYEFSRPEESELDDRLLWPKRTSTCDPNENTSDVE